ncbi:MAG: hypothetical protein ACI849_000975 [Patiriisocius sp.]|jgi:hypothetical protein
MKHNLLLLILFFTIATIAQDSCDYKINVDTEEEVFQLTQESLIDFTVGDKKTVFVYFSLMKEGNVKSVVLSISLNSEEIPPLICYDKKSRISFQLSNGEYVSAPYLGIDTCGRQTKDENAINNSISEASFYLDEVALKRLVNSPVERLRISTLKNNFNLVLRDVISNDQLKKSIYPKEFFINSLPCIE